MVRLALFLLLGLCLAGCRVVEPLPAPTSAIQVDKAAAVRAAEGACPGLYQHPLEPARLLQARLISRRQAGAIGGCLQGSADPSGCLSATPEPLPAAPLAWLVLLEGAWQVEGPPAPGLTPLPTTPPAILTRCLVVVDAGSGEAGPVWNW